MTRDEINAVLKEIAEDSHVNPADRIHACSLAMHLSGLEPSPEGANNG